MKKKKKKKKKKDQLNSFCLVKKHNFTQYMVKSPKNPRNGCANLRQNHTKQENHNPFMQSFMLKLVLKLFHHGPGNIDMKFGGGTEQKERVNGKQESLTA